MSSGPYESSASAESIDTRSITRALRRPMGRYTYERASQLAGIPKRTLHHWAKEGIFLPDFNDGHPKFWSYRDLVLIRLFVWLRGEGQSPKSASRRVEIVRRELETISDDVIPNLHADRHALLLGDEEFDRYSGEQVLPGLGPLLDVFEITKALPEIGGRVWGPNLIHPSAHTSILPMVMAGEPCIARTRITTANMWALRYERGLSDKEIVALYPGVVAEQVDDAIAMESRLRPAA